MKKVTGILLLLMLTLLFPKDVQAATPRVMVWDYQVEGKEVMSGKEFPLHITLKNTAVKKVRNLKLTIQAEGGEFLPIKGAGTAYLESIEANEEAQLDFQMAAIPGLEERSYKLNIRLEYEGNDGADYMVEECIFIPVTLEQRISVTDIFILEEDIRLGDTVELTAMANNLGEGTLYNVTAKVSGYHLDTRESYIGNITSGQSGTIDILTKAKALTVAGPKDTILISYEDKKGNVKEQEFNLGTITVGEPDYTNIQVIKESADISGIAKTVDNQSV